MRDVRWCAAAAVVLAGIARGAQTPKDVKITLETERQEYLVGEAVIVKMGVENVTDHEVTISVGGDYRGGTRAHRFLVTATDEAGREAIDPDPVQVMFGGMGGDRTIKPGGTAWMPVYVMRYRMVDHAGTYKFVIGHDLGMGKSKWGRDEGATMETVPHAELTLRFRMPTEAEAGELVERLVGTEEEGLVMVGETRPKQDVARDLEVLRLPVYVPALKKHVADGGRVVVQGIGSVETPAGTAALIDVLSDGREDVVQEALRQLQRRVPGWALQPFPEGQDKTGRAEGLVKAAWREEFGPRLEAYAVGEVRKAEAGRQGFVDEACEILMHLGGPAEMPAVEKALEAAAVRNEHLPNYKFVQPPQGVDSLARAAAAMAGRGVAVTDRGSVAGRVVERFRIMGDKGYRPAGWEGVLNGMVGDALPAVRMLGVEAWARVPEGVPGEVAARLPELLADKDRAVRCVAMMVAGKAEATAVAERVLEVARTSEDEGEVIYAGAALPQLKRRGAWLAICASRLAEEGRWQWFFEPLGDCLDGLGGGRFTGTPEAGGATRAAAAWQQFVAKHREALDAGKKVPYAEADPAMSPRPNSFSTKDGGQWPVWK